MARQNMKFIASLTGAAFIVLVSVFASAAAPKAPEGMVYITAGEFLMGNDGKNLDASMGVLPVDELPQRKIYLKPFYIDKYEVTNKQYKDYLDSLMKEGVKAFSHYDDEGVPIPDRWSFETYPPGEDNNPIVDVDWYMAGRYCEKLGKRLPTEEEWEKAARGTDGRAFPWGNEHKAGYTNNRDYWETRIDMEDANVLPVGSFPKDVSPYGVYDMAGNAFEWTTSLHKLYPGNVYKRKYFDKVPLYVLRGGAFNTLSYEYGRTTSRYSRQPSDAQSANAEWHTALNIGFRCVKDAE